MVFNRHRRREILFWWLYFFSWYSFLIFFGATLFYGNAQSRRRGAKEAPAESMLETLFTCISGLLSVNCKHCKHCDPATANISLPASSFLLQTTSGNNIQQLLPLTRYNIFVPPWIRKTQTTTPTIRRQKTHTLREKNARVVLTCAVRPGVLLSNNATKLPSSAARNAVS